MYRHLRCLGGNSFINTPGWVHMKKATLNIQNDDEYCFLYCALAVSNYKSQHAERAAPYRRHMKDLNIDGLKFPMTVDQIAMFELNNADYAINVIYPNSEDKSFVPLYASPHRNRKHVVNLLLLSDMEKRHYIVIRNLSASCHLEIRMSINVTPVHSAYTVSQQLQVNTNICQNAASMVFKI